MDGIIYTKYAINENNKLIKWQKTLDGKYVSKHYVISSADFFMEKIAELAETWQEKLLVEMIKTQSVPKPLDWAPLVSVIMSVKNGAATIVNSIKSIAKQSYKNIELVIVDDKSTDNTVEIINNIQLKIPLILLKNAENRGCYFSRNRALTHANGDIIAIQDADDLSDKCRIQKSVEKLVKKNVDFVLTNGRDLNKIIDNVGRIKVTMATFVCGKQFFQKYGTWDEETRHSGDLELLDRAYFLKYGEYKFKNFWYWLNYTPYEPEFYYHIYEDLYYIGTDGDRITTNNKLKIRSKYLMGRRKKFMEKNITNN